MKKKVTIVLVIISIVAISIMIMFSIYKSSEACRKANAAIQWDCSVTCAEESTPDSYVITYSDAKISSKTGVFRTETILTLLCICSAKENRNSYLAVFLRVAAILF